MPWWDPMTLARKLWPRTSDENDDGGKADDLGDTGKTRGQKLLPKNHSLEHISAFLGCESRATGMAALDALASREVVDKMVAANFSSQG